jgi:rubrerythrin
MHTDDVITKLNALVQLDFDAAKTYERACQKIDLPEVRNQLEIFRQDHLRHVIELSEAIARLGGTPHEPHRDVKGVVLEGLTALRSVSGTHGALSAMRLNEKLTNRSYDEALRADLPADIAFLVESNRADERRHLAYIETTLGTLARDKASPEARV